MVGFDQSYMTRTDPTVYRKTRNKPVYFVLFRTRVMSNFRRSMGLDFVDWSEIEQLSYGSTGTNW